MYSVSWLGFVCILFRRSSSSTGIYQVTLISGYVANKEQQQPEEVISAFAAAKVRLLAPTASAFMAWDWLHLAG
jgi:hypothetical protein